MPLELAIPTVGESVTEALISQWFKKEGDIVRRDEPVAELETDKVTLELPSPVDGVLVEIKMKEGETAEIGAVIAMIEEQELPAEPTAPAAVDEAPPAEAGGAPSAKPVIMPAAARLLDEHGLEPGTVTATGPGGRLLKEDVERHVAEQQAKPKTAPAATAPDANRRIGDRLEDVVPMTPIRKRIAERLVAAQQGAALLTTFNEVDMSAVMELRRQYKDAFAARHGIKLGFMSFFVKAAVDALRQFPKVNAEISGTDIIYKNYYDIGIAVSTDRGLLVPIVRSAERLGFAEIEATIADFGGRAREGKIKLDELEGGTFTITNGGIFGSMLSTPIINPPQSGVLGMHAIEERPIAKNGEVVIHPMMYLALSYDHRIVDGREAVSFLKRIKDAIEDPSRMLLEV